MISLEITNVSTVMLQVRIFLYSITYMADFLVTMSVENEKLIQQFSASKFRS